MGFYDAFFGSDQSIYTAYAIIAAIIAICLTILLTATDVPIGNRILIVLFIVVTLIPSIFLTLFELTCIVTGGTEPNRWWCYTFAWILAAFIIIYCIFVVIISLISLFNYNKAIATVNNEDAKYKITVDESNDVAKDIIIADEARKKYIEKFYNEGGNSQDVFSMVTNNPAPIPNMSSSPPPSQPPPPNNANAPTSSQPPQQVANFGNYSFGQQQQPNMQQVANFENYSPEQSQLNMQQVANFENYSEEQSQINMQTVANFANYTPEKSQPVVKTETFDLTIPNKQSVPVPAVPNSSSTPSSKLPGNEPETKSMIKLGFSDYNQDNIDTFDNYYNYSAFTN